MSRALRCCEERQIYCSTEGTDSEVSVSTGVFDTELGMGISGGLVTVADSETETSLESRSEDLDSNS